MSAVMTPLFPLILLFWASPLARVAVAAGCYTSIVSFGDSLADTGNAMRCGIMPRPVGRLPYGQTFFGNATGRYCDGRLVIDFIAEAIGLPLVRPYLAGGSTEDFRYGVNFAVGGASALNISFLKAHGLDLRSYDYSLGTQIEWFKQFFASSGSDASSVLSNALVLMGEIGGNDYNHALALGKRVEELEIYVPDVISAISSAISELIELGGQTLLVPGNIPFGCSPVYLAHFLNEKNIEYDEETGCIVSLNKFSQYHNRLLQEELDRLQGLYPHAVISYADYYDAVMNIFHNPQLYGFKDILSACCGFEGPHRINLTAHAMCGQENSNVCDDPSTAISWDGEHLTEAAYHIIANGLLSGTYAQPSFMEVCSGIQMQYIAEL